MHSLFGKRGVVLAGLLALAVAAVTPSTASAGPEPGAKPRGFRLFARSLGAITINRVYCGLATTGEVCVDSTNSSTIGGGYWPKGTADQYVFNSGLQLAGIIGGTKPGNPWGGDTTGAFFFDPKGTTQHGEQVEPIYNATSLEDQANWPEAAFVPQGDASEELFNPLLRGRLTASQGDVWWLSWEGNPGQNAGRQHPLGIVVEQRGMGWNFPVGNEDILYFIYTFYNVTSLDPAAYAGIRPGLREIMIQKAQDFHALNNEAFGITLPQEGYSIENLFAAFGADMDVADAGDNYSSVVLPFALGHTYGAHFDQPEGWTFDPGIFAPPFFPAAGFVGVKYLRSPTGAGEIQLFSNTINGGQFGDAANTKQLYRYLSGNISQAAGDAACSYDPVEDRLCFVNNDDPDDMRFFQSSTPLSLAPGQFGSIVVAYIFAAPYLPASYTPGTILPPGDPLRMTSVAQLNGGGANMVDSIAGLLSFEDGNGNNIPEQSEFRVARGSLLDKALVAQEIFDNRFLLPFAPDAPEFFLVPGDNQVTVLWRPSPSETGGDPFFAIASNPTRVPEGGGDPIVNPLYDPNYREFDVEGYRVYRGRVDAPNALTLLAQFDYAGTEIIDFQGQINPVNTCAPELEIFTECPEDYIPAEFQPGVPRTVGHSVPLTGQIVQLKVPGTRAELADGTAIILAADTALTGLDAGFPELSDTGVPFVYVDEGVRNNFRYFYSVTAFDVNSFQSGPSSLESPRITKPVTPRVVAENHERIANLTTSAYGRGVAMTDVTVPTLDPATGKFSKPFPPANGWDFQLAGFVAELVSESGAAVARLDSLHIGNAYAGIPGTMFVTINPGPNELQIQLDVAQSATNGTTVTEQTFPLVAVDPALATTFGVDPDLSLTGSLTSTFVGNYYTASFGRGCVNGATGFGSGRTCSYNGARWFAGPSPQTNETKDNPTAPANQANALFGSNYANLPNYNNAGELPGVDVIHEARSYQTIGTLYRQVEGMLGTVARAADFNVYWGAGGVVDSVIDVTHNVVVEFDPAIGAGWGILNASTGAAGGSLDGRPGVATVVDFGCVEGFHDAPQVGAAGGVIECTAPTPWALTNTAELGPVVEVSGNISNAATKDPAAIPGFFFYLPGHIFLMEMSALPAEGTVWTMRSYVGAIDGGRGGDAGEEGDYVFRSVTRPFTAVGAEVRITYDVVNQINAATLTDLDQVHTVPDPYYVTSEFEQTTDNKIIRFVNLPDEATIRIYSSSGVLVDVIEHNSPTSEGAATWNVRNRNNQVVASGVYFYHIEAGDARRVGRFTIVNFAQ